MVNMASSFSLMALTSALTLLTLAAIPINAQTNPLPRSPVLYTVLAPKVIGQYSTYQVSVTIEPRTESTSPAPGPVTIVASIVHNNTKSYKSDPVTIQPGNTVFIPITVGVLVQDRSYNLTIEGTTSGSNTLIIEDVSEVRVQRKTTAVFVQTDKVIYKPGETVRFRVVVLDRELKPFPDSPVTKTAVSAPPLINVIIFDSRRNVIKIWKQQSVPGGIFSNNLTLSAEPVLGDWSIQTQIVNSGANKSFVVDADSQKTHSFSVDQYILPKFNVEIVLPPFATFNDSRITAQVKASYTYGKPIGAGEVVVSIAETNRAYYHHNGLPPAVTKNLQLENGIAFVEFDLVKDLSLNGDWERRITVQASVVESLTGKRQNGSSTITIYKYPYKLSLLPGAENYKPGFPFTVTIKVTTQDGVPVSDPSSDALVVHHAFSWTDEGSVFKAPIPVTGLVRFTFQTPSNELLGIHGFEATYKGVKQWFSIPEKVTTESKTYLQLSVDGNEGLQAVVQVGQELQVKVESNKPFNAVYYQLVGRGQLLTHGKKPVANNGNKETTFQVQIPAAAAPTAYLVAYVVSSDEKHEITSDSIKINTESKLNNYLNITLSNNTREPGQDVILDLKTRPTSLIALRGVDQSVLILKEDKDLDLKAVNDELRRLDGNYYSYHYGHSYSSRVFDKAGLVLLTNANIYRPSHYYGGPSPYPLTGTAEYGFGGPNLSLNKIASASAAPSGAVGFSGRPSAPPSVRVRTHFPETWLWEEVHANEVTRLNKTVPDTLTSWVITGYSIHSQFGLGVLESPEKLTVVRPFFITLNVPHSAVKGEVLAVQVLVHNYLGHDAEVTVTLNNDRQQFEFFEHSRNVRQTNSGDAPTPNKTQNVKNVRVQPSNVGTVTFIIVPSQFGTIELAVKGVTEFAGDALSRPLVVRPPGQLQTVNQVALIDHLNVDTSSVVLETSFPEDRVVGADKVQISVVSDILGPSIANLDNLLQMPYGCGEQNLVTFVPDIVILDYLTTTHALTPEIKAKALRYLESGYQRQLTYVHDDGSFSAFGKSDQYGSTWLTAFTIKSFYAAKPYITVDEEVISKGLSFLSRQQSENGSFGEPGRVLHSGLQGGSSKGIGLTAYVLLTFIETADSRRIVGNANASATHQAVIDKGLQYLVSQATEDSKDIYGLLLTSYALELANHPKKDQVRALVEKNAITSTDGQLKYWEQLPEPEPSPVPTTTTTAPGSQSTVRPLPRPIPYRPKTKPVSVEMSSYALLTYLTHKPDDLATALPIVKWLLTKRNAAGGFISTQDTVVGLTALGKFAGFTHATSGNKELNLDISAQYATDLHKDVQVRKENAIVLQSFELPNTTLRVHFNAKGHGMALVQLTNTFYVESIDTQQAFSIDVKVGSPALKELKLDVCTQFNRNDKTPSNMAVVEVNLPTGYTFDTSQLSSLKSLPKVMRYDVTESDSQVNIYFDSLNSDKSCVTLYANLIFRVGKQSPSYVRVYDYYDTTRSGKTNYESPQLELCAVEGEEKENCI